MEGKVLPSYYWASFVHSVTNNSDNYSDITNYAPNSSGSEVDISRTEGDPDISSFVPKWHSICLRLGPTRSGENLYDCVQF